jgi:hypothetical protein
METCEWPSIWEIIKSGNWEKFGEYAKVNGDIIKTEDAEFSVVGAVAAVMAKKPEVASTEGIEICAAHGANMDEVDKATGKPAAIILAESLKHSLSGGAKEEDNAESLKRVLQALKHHDAEFKEVEKIIPKEKLKPRIDSIGGYFKREFGVKYVKSLLLMAERLKHIGKTEATNLLNQAKKGRGITENKMVTLSRILDGKKFEAPHGKKSAILREVTFTPAGKKHLMASVAALKDAVAAKESTDSETEI